MTGRSPVVLAIAGSDSSGGAGIQADLKTATVLGVYGATVITALTAQNTQGVQGVHPVPADFVAAQLDSVLDDVDVTAVKIGMLGDPDVVAVVAAALDRLPGVPVVLDPVMVATSGHRLVADETVDEMRRHLVPRTTVVTPNAPEAALLTGRTVTSAEDLEPIGRHLVALGSTWALVKGGHLEGEVVVDALVSAEDAHRLGASRIWSQHTHGTGCTLSSAVATALARGEGVPTAVATARSYLRRAIAAGRGGLVGQGHGPVDHLVDLR